MIENFKLLNIHWIVLKEFVTCVNVLLMESFVTIEIEGLVDELKWDNGEYQLLVET